MKINLSNGSKFYYIEKKPNFFQKDIPVTVIAPWKAINSEKTFLNTTSQRNKGEVKTYAELKLEPNDQPNYYPYKSIIKEQNFNKQNIEHFRNIPEIPYNKLYQYNEPYFLSPTGLIIIKLFICLFIFYLLVLFLK